MMQQQSFRYVSDMQCTFFHALKKSCLGVININSYIFLVRLFEILIRGSHTMEGWLSEVSLGNHIWDNLTLEGVGHP